MPQNNRITGQKWKECDRCGFDWPVNKLYYQNGAWVCPKCWLKDNRAPQRIRP